MNVLEIISGQEINGAVNHCLLLSRELARRGHRVTLASPPGAWIASQLKPGEVESIACDLHRWPPDALHDVASAIRARGIDVVHTHMSRAHFFGVLLRLLVDVPVVATAHSRFIQAHWMFNHRVIAVSQAAARFHRRFNLVPRSRIEVVYGFVDTHRFDRRPSEVRAQHRASLGVVEDERPVVGFVGSLFPEKGLRGLVQAWPGILARVPEAKLLVMGDGSPAYVDRLHREAERLGIAGGLIWLNRREDVPEIMSALDLVVLPSLSDTFPLVCLEAMACGLAVVATAVAGIPECVADGETGLLVPPADNAALGDAVTELLLDPVRRRRLGEAGRERAVARFSVASQVPKVEAALALAAFQGRRARDRQQR